MAVEQAAEKLRNSGGIGGKLFSGAKAHVDSVGQMRRAHALIYEKLPKRTRAVLALPEKERASVIRERKKVLAEREKAKCG